MPEASEQPRRQKRARHLRVPVQPEEAQVIEAQARAVGMSVAAYLRAVGCGYQPRALADRDQVDALLKINGDLGRLGGLLKLWLSDDEKLVAFDRGQMGQAILSALRRIDENRTELREVVRRVLRDGGQP
ncbi:MAG TPA: conjugal transfer protein TraJ [Polyangiales bacterium]